MSFPETLKLPKKLELEKVRLKPGETALLVIDVQNDFANPLGKLYARGAEKIIEPIKNLIGKARGAGATIIYTQDWHVKGDPEFEIWGEHALAGTWGAEIVDELKPEEAPKLHCILEHIARESGIKKPKLMLVPLKIPNAFAYGTPLSGYRVAVTEGLLKTLSPDEVEAVIAHEVGHIAHGDMQVMMVASMLPAVLYHVGRVLYYSSYFGSRRDDRGELVLAGGIAVALATALWLISLRLSRLREYYADAHAATVIPRGARRLQNALIKIAAHSNPDLGAQAAQVRPLFISDPVLPPVDPEEIKRALLEKKPSVSERIVGIFSTHPNLVDRLRALEELATQVTW